MYTSFQTEKRRKNMFCRPKQASKHFRQMRKFSRKATDIFLLDFSVEK